MDKAPPSSEEKKILVWLAQNNFVPSLSLMNHQNLAPDAFCPICSSSEELFIHCVKDYTTFILL
jgi:hypothetical protein